MESVIIYVFRFDSTILRSCMSQTGLVLFSFYNILYTCIHCAGNCVSQQVLCYVSFPKFTCWFTRACNGVLLSTCHHKSTSPTGKLPSGNQNHVGH